MFNKERGTRVNIVRLVNAYGPRQSVAPPFGPAKVRKITPAFVCRALTGEDIEVYGDGSRSATWSTSQDGALALVKALEKAERRRRVRHRRRGRPGPQDSRTVNEVAQARHRGRRRKGFDEVAVKHLPMRPGEIPGAQVSADTSTLALVGMSPDKLVPLEDGIADVVAWYAEKWLPGYRVAA
jgi:UDP-glucose 4-epimerase